MVERVTGNSIGATVLGANQQTLARLATYQQQLATGKRVNQVSDDPGAAKQALRYRAEGTDVGTYLANIGKATAFLNASDAALGDMNQVLDQAKAFAVQGTNGSQNAASRKALAASVDALISRGLDLANTVHDGRYIFGGTATVRPQPPFVRNSGDTGVDYSGTLDSFSVAVGPNSTAQVNTDGHSLFQGDNNVFQSLYALRDALNANDPDTVNSLISKVDAAHNQINTVQGALGGRVQRLELVQNQLQMSKASLDGLVSQSEDADMTEVMSKLQLTQTSLQAGLQAGGKIMQTTLLDFLK